MSKIYSHLGDMKEEIGAGSLHMVVVKTVGLDVTSSNIISRAIIAATVVAVIKAVLLIVIVPIDMVDVADVVARETALMATRCHKKLVILVGSPLHRVIIIIIMGEVLASPVKSLWAGSTTSWRSRNFWSISNSLVQLRRLKF